MSVYDQDNRANIKRVFISYSSIDRIRTSGLALLLEAMGHQVFHDHRTIKPGMQWKAALQDGLDDADATMVFWTRHAARSDWVRKEYEYFAGRYPDRLLIPVVGDETPLSELLKTRQQADFAPVVNEVLEMKRKMKKEGAPAGDIEQAVTKRLADAGVDLKTKRQKRLLFLFLGFGWLLTLLRYPGALAQKSGRAVVEKTAQATLGQLAVVAAAALIGLGGSYQTARSLADRSIPGEIDALEAQIGDLRAANRDLTRANDLAHEQNRDLQDQNRRLIDADDELGSIRAAIDDLGKRVDDIPRPPDPVGCISEESFEACRGEIVGARDDLNRQLAGMFGRLDDLAERVTRRDIAQPPAGRQPSEPPPAGGGDKRPSTTVVLGTPGEPGGCDRAPTPLSREEPEYPESARLDNIQGEVALAGVIDVDGSVTDVEVRQADAEVLGQAAVRAVRNWKFTRCTVDQKPVPLPFTVRVDFHLHD